MSGTLARDPGRTRFSMLPEALLTDTSISDRAVRLWARLDRFAGDREVAFPSIPTLAHALGCSTASIDRAIAELVTTGWITRTHRRGEVAATVVNDRPRKPRNPRHGRGDPTSQVRRPHVTRDVQIESHEGESLSERGGDSRTEGDTRAPARAESPPTPEPPPNPEPAPTPPPPAGDTGGIPPRRCPEHIRTLGPVPACGACKEARLVAEQWETAHPVSAANARNADHTPKHPACPDCHGPAPAGHCARCARNHSVATPSTVHALRAALPGRQRSPAGRRRECPHGRPVAWLDAAGTVEACPDCRRGVPGPETAADGVTGQRAATG